MMRDGLSSEFAKAQAEALFKARIQNLEHLLNQPALLGDRTINPADVHAAEWTEQINRGILPSKAELAELDRGGWPESSLLTTRGIFG